MLRLNQTDRRPSRAERGENCGFNDDEEGMDLEGLPPFSRTDSCNVVPIIVPDNCDEEEVECPRMVLRPHVTVVEQGPLISGRLDAQLIEGARMLLYQFYGAVNEENAVSVNDLYSFLYDREVNKTEERRSTLINFRQVMLDVEYIRYVVGPSNEIKIWTLAAGTAQHRGGMVPLSRRWQGWARQ